MTDHGRSPQNSIPWRERPTLRESEVALLIGISARQVGRMVENGELELRRIGTVQLITTRSLVAWEQSSETETSQAETIEVRSSIRRAAALWSKGVS